MWSDVGGLGHGVGRKRNADRRTQEATTTATRADRSTTTMGRGARGMSLLVVGVSDLATMSSVGDLGEGGGMVLGGA